MKKPFSKRVGGVLTIQVPLFAVVAFCLASAIAGHQLYKKNSRDPLVVTGQPKYAIAERGTVIMQYVLSHPSETTDQLQANITAPMLAVLQKYSDDGYIVLEASRDENNNYVVAALPASAKNITKELAEAIDQAELVGKQKEGATNGK